MARNRWGQIRGGGSSSSLVAVRGIEVITEYGFLQTLGYAGTAG